jgi:hypothetical protein
MTDVLSPTRAVRGPGDLGPVDDGAAAPDWALVRQLRTSVAAQLSERLREHPDMSRDSQRELARALTTRAVADWVDQQATAGAVTPTVSEEARIADAVLAAIFGLGRIQPLVDDPTVENIDIAGCDQVWLEYADGRWNRARRLPTPTPHWSRRCKASRRIWGRPPAASPRLTRRCG